MARKVDIARRLGVTEAKDKPADVARKTAAFGLPLDVLANLKALATATDREQWALVTEALQVYLTAAEKAMGKEAKAVYTHLAKRYA